MANDSRVNKLVLRYTVVLLGFVVLFMPFAASDESQRQLASQKALPTQLIDAILDQSVPAVATDWRGQIVFANSLAIQTIRTDDIHGMHVSNWLYMEEAERIEQLMMDARSSGKGVDKCCQSGLCIDGEFVERTTRIKSYESGKRMYIITHEGPTGY